MKLFIYGRILDTLLRMKKHNRFYLIFWKLWHEEKRRIHSGKNIYSKGSR
jgi:hypothetical protein